MTDQVITESNKILIGINRALFEKRLYLGLTRKQAAKEIGITKFKLTVIERGYLRPSEKDLQKIKEAYHLRDSFFVEHLGYPIILNEKVYEPFKVNSILKKLGNSLWMKIASLIIGIGFIGMIVGGIYTIPKTTGSTASYYTNELLETKQYVLDNGTKGTIISGEDIFTLFVPDSFYFLEAKDYVPDNKYSSLTLNFFEKDVNLAFTFHEGKRSYTLDDINYTVRLNERFYSNQTRRVHFEINRGINILCVITADAYLNPLSGEFTYNYIGVLKTDITKGNHLLDPNSSEYLLFTTIFKANYEEFTEDLAVFFNDSHFEIYQTYPDYVYSSTRSTTNLYSSISLGRTLAMWGFFLAVAFIGIFVLGIFEKSHIEKRALRFVKEENIEKNAVIEISNPEVNKKKIPKNTWLNLTVSEFAVRALSLILLFISSISTYFLFLNAVKIDFMGISTSLYAKEVLSNLSVIAVMLLYFVKLDIYQNKKSALGMSIFLFILGLLYYLALLIIYYALAGSSVLMAKLSDLIFNVLPGNIVWGVLVFNLIIIFMFAPIDENKASKRKVLLFRLTTLIPFSYLIASTIISIGMKVSNWQMPYAVSSLFFYKAPMITVFALAYCVGVFIYRKYSIKTYGTVNGKIYQNGNKYNFIRNNIAAITVLAIGIFDLVCFFCWKDNVLGFGSNYYMLVAVPFIIFYHPHIGKRNSVWDMIFNVLYGITYIIGIVLIVFACLKILATI